MTWGYWAFLVALMALALTFDACWLAQLMTQRTKWRRLAFSRGADLVAADRLIADQARTIRRQKMAIAHLAGERARLSEKCGEVIMPTAPEVDRTTVDTTFAGEWVRDIV